ncbi:MAG: ABC transporter permease [Vampirovibrionia bacterium]|jgi:oligopeptide transport system permease protein
MLKSLRLVANKLSTFLFSIFFISSASFFLLRLLPGSPFSSDRHLPAEVMARMEAKYGLNKPLLEQYFSYISKIFTAFDFGPSLKYPNREVMDILAEAMPVSFTLGGLAFIIAITAGISGGIYLGYKANHRKGFDPLFFILSNYADAAISLPSFVTAGLLIGLFGLYFNLLPVALWEGPEYMILPALTLSVGPTAYIMRITRTAFANTYEQGYIKTAMAKGLDQFSILYKHALVNALLPILAYIGPLFAILITGSFVVEFVYALPGMGKYFVTAFINRDYFLVTAVVVVFSAILTASNLLVEVLNPLVNPKLRQ